MTNQAKAVYKTPRLARVSIEPADILLTSGAAEQPRGELSNLYTDGAKAALLWDEIFYN